MEVEDARTASKGCTGRYTSPAVFCYETLDKIIFSSLKLDSQGRCSFSRNQCSTAILLGLFFWFIQLYFDGAVAGQDMSGPRLSNLLTWMQCLRCFVWSHCHRSVYFSFGDFGLTRQLKKTASQNKKLYILYNQNTKTLPQWPVRNRSPDSEDCVRDVDSGFQALCSKDQGEAVTAAYSNAGLVQTPCTHRCTMTKNDSEWHTTISDLCFHFMMHVPVPAHIKLAATLLHVCAFWCSDAGKLFFEFVSCNHKVSHSLSFAISNTAGFP